MTNNEAVKNAVVWGGYYRVKHSRWNNDQSYGTSCPVQKSNGEVWMVDTYELKSPGLKNGSATEAAIDRAINVFPDGERGDWVVSQAIGNYYYRNAEHITHVEMLNDDYELICDLHDFRLVKRSEDVRHFASHNIISRVRLYHEHGYSRDYGPIGVELVRKGSTTLPEKEFDSIVSDIYSKFTMPDGGFLTQDLISKAKNLIEQLEDQNQLVNPQTLNRYKQACWIYNRLNEMLDEIRRYEQDTAYEPHFDYEDSERIITLGDLQDVKRYLENDCYCPHEVYDFNGMYYELFYPEFKCYVISVDKTILVITRVSETAFPELLSISFGTNDQGEYRITGMTRFDVTDNNIKVLMHVNQTNEISPYKKIDEYTYADNEFVINDRINKLLGLDNRRLR